MRNICPGQDRRNLRVELYRCPNCGTEVEIFSDEVKVKCYNCGTMVFKEKFLPASTGVLRHESAWVKNAGGR